jgi:Tfp pilus assembly protein PilF
MKKLLMICTVALTLPVFAQKSKVESAAIYLRNNEIEDAKKAIDEAVEHPDTKTDAKAWFYYVSVYDTIYRNKQYMELFNDPNIVEKFHNACKNCINYDVKNRYGYYCKEQAIINSAFMAFNKGIENYEAQKFDDAIKYYQMVLDVLPYDKNGDLRKNNLAETNVILYMAYAAIQGDKKNEAKKLINKLMDLNYDDPVIYIQMVVMHLEEGDTASALNYVDKGKAKFGSNKDLTNLELNIYLAQGKQDVLLDKLNNALENDPFSASLYFVRGNVYDNFATNENKKAKKAREEATAAQKKALTEKDPAKKQRLNAEAASKRKIEGELNKKAAEYSAKAEADYLKVIELEPTNIDAYYNLGALTNNKTTEIAEQINNITALTQAEYDKKYNPLKTKLDSILKEALKYFEEALALAEQKPEDTEENKKIKKAYLFDILSSMQQVYANLGDEQKTIELKKRREAL